MLRAVSGPSPIEPPRLPDTDDPFTLLGVVPPTSRHQLRAAYLRLSKAFGPEPDELERVRRAYQLALARLHWSGEGDDSGAPPPPADGPAAAVVVDDLLAGRDVAGRVLEELELDQLRPLAAHPDLGWAVLRRQPESWAALEIFSLRLQDLLMTGAVAQALDEIDGDPVRSDRLEVEALAQVVMSVLLAAAWSEGERALRLLADWAKPGDEGAAALVRQALALAPAWQRLEAEQPLPAALRRFVELFPSVGYAFRRTLVDDLRAALAGERAEVVRAIDRMHLADQRLVRVLDQMTDGLVFGETLAYDQLPEREREYIAAAMQKVAWRLSAPPGARRWSRMLWGAAVAVLAYVAIGGYVGLLVGTGILIALFLNEALSRLGQVMHATRERIADAVIETGLPPDRMLEWAHRRAATGPVPNNPFGFEAGIADDLPLHTLGRLARVCLLWSREPD